MRSLTLLAAALAGIILAGCNRGGADTDDVSADEDVTMTQPSPGLGLPGHPADGAPAEEEAVTPPVIIGVGPGVTAPIAEPKPVEPPKPLYVRDWVVSPTGNDSASGTAAAPLRTINRAIGLVSPGERILVKAGRYDERIQIGTNARAGTSTSRIVLEGEGKPTLVSSAGDWILMSIERPYWTVQGFDIDAQKKRQIAVAFIGDTRESTLRGNEIHDGSHGSGVTTFGNSTGAVIEDNDIHDFFVSAKDSHGILVQHTSKNVTIRNNDIHHNSGDSIQCLGPEDEGGSVPANGVLIEGNDLHHSVEQAIDIKTCHNVTVRKNRMHGFRRDPVRLGNGAMVIHYSAKNIVIEENDFFDAGLAVGVGGNHVGPVASGVIIRNNLIHDMLTEGGMTGGGVRIDGSDGTQVVNNTFARLPGPGIVLGTGNGGSTTKLVVKNNIVAGTPLVELGSSAPSAVIDSNLYKPNGTFELGGTSRSFAEWKASGKDALSVMADPALHADTLAPGPVAVDKGVNVGLPFCGAAPDLGAVESGC